MICPAAQSIQDSFLRDEGKVVPDLEAEFMEIFLWYDGFTGERMKLLPYERQDIEVIVRKMEDARQSRDYHTSDHLREVLRKSGVVVKNDAH